MKISMTFIKANYSSFGRPEENGRPWKKFM